MSYYYKYNFVSPEPVYATVKEELKSYFDTGAVDDLLFPTYLDKCLKKLGRTTYVISQEILEISDFQARLPDNFYAVREAWMCSEIPQYPYQTANSFYSQAATQTTIQVAPLTVGGVNCDNPKCTQPGCNGECMPLLIQAVYKTNQEVARSYKQEYLLKPGNISARTNCGVNYTDNWSFAAPVAQGQAGVDGNFTPGQAGIDSFDIRDNKFVTNFRNGIVHLLFYATEYDDIGNQLIPDNYRIREFVEAFIKFKVFETLTNQTNDETFNQLQQKLAYYERKHDEAYILADIEIKKQDAWTKQRRIKNDLNRFNMYELPNRTNRYGWRRNN
jgi:hypothetical protein